MLDEMFDGDVPECALTFNGSIYVGDGIYLTKEGDFTSDDS